jgi:RNA polymerase-interacting CarD/CdnL/TRCF family regulator
MPADNERVGYGSPPKHSQFQPGQSGNPRGRPRGARGLRAELKAELDEKVEVTFDGQKRKLSKRRLIIKQLTAQAAKGDIRAADKIISLLIQAEGFEDQRPQQRKLSDTDQQILARITAMHAAEPDSAATDIVPANAEPTINDAVPDDINQEE